MSFRPALERMQAMKHSKIACRLILYFSAALLLFALIVGGAFTFLSARHTMELRRQDLQGRAETIAKTVYGFLSGTAKPMNGEHSGKGQGKASGGNPLHGTGFGAYMRFLDDIAMADVWVIDSNSKTITPGSEHSDVIEYEELPEDGEAVIDEALNGSISFSESFSDVLGERTLSVGVPIRQDDTAEPVGAVLLHTPVQGISDAVSDGLWLLLLSVLAALLLAVPAAVLLSLKFTKPLNRMKDTAVRLADGDFSAVNALRQNDEIGELAATMDLLAVRLKDASQESSRLEQMRRDFISNVSHELRTPVTVLRGSLEAITDGIITEPAQIQEYQQQMLRESLHLQRLVDDLLELTRLQNADFRIEKAPLELRQLAEDVRRSARRLAEPKGVVLHLESGAQEFSFTGDYGRLRQMLLVVVDNAIKFSPPDETVSMRLFQQDGEPALSITDHGPGISPEDLPRIFERFRTSGTVENRTGTGLGLPIARQIAVRHGITIQVESRPGNTVFTFLFRNAHVR